MKSYELIFSENSKGCFRISLVKDPAVEAKLIKFSKESPLFFANDEKRIIYSVAMRPNKLIFRKDINGEPANVFYTAETIERLQQNYFKQNGNSGTNLNHEDDNAEGIYPFESWIVKDAENDKSKAIGLETINGDWVMAHKIESDEIWNKVKSGDFDGLSIEAFLAPKENINFNNEKMTKLQQFIKMCKMVFALDATEIAPGYWATSKEVGTVVLDKEGEPAKEAEFEIDGEKYRTDSEGKILVSVEDEADKMTLEQAMEKIAKLETELAEAEKDKADAEVEKTKAEEELQTMKSESKKVSENLVKMTKEKTEADAAFLKFKKENTPVKKIENTPAEIADIPYEKMTNFQRMKFNREKRG